MKHTDIALRRDLPFAIMYGDGPNEQDQEDDHPEEYGVNDLCPVCLRGHFDYNGVLNLECDECKYTLAGCST